MEGPDLKKTGEFLVAHWPEFAIGAVVLVGAFFMLGGGSGGGSATPSGTTACPYGIDPATGYCASPGSSGAASNPALEAAQLQAATAVALQTIATNGSIANQTIATAGTTNQTAIDASTSAYNTTVQTEGQTAQYAMAALSGQNAQQTESLATGFSNYIMGTAQETASAANAVSATAASNNGVAGNVLGKTLMGAAALAGGVAAIANPGSFAGSIGSSLIRSTPMVSNGLIYGTGLPVQSVAQPLIYGPYQR